MSFRKAAFHRKKQKIKRGHTVDTAYLNKLTNGQLRANGGVSDVRILS